MSRKINYCQVDGCSKPAHGLGYCNTHYRRFKKHGDAEFQKVDWHGESKTKEYSIWNAIKYRCQNPNCEMYHRYGGRGITVCERWNNSFSSFLEDMGTKPFENAQIDRIDNDGNYEPGNCRWVTPEENRLNQKNRVVTPKIKAELIEDRKNGLSYTKIGKKHGLPMSTVYYALKEGRI